MRRKLSDKAMQTDDLPRMASLPNVLRLSGRALGVMTTQGQVDDVPA